MAIQKVAVFSAGDAQPDNIPSKREKDYEPRSTKASRWKSHNAPDDGIPKMGCVSVEHISFNRPTFKLEEQRTEPAFWGRERRQHFFIAFESYWIISCRLRLDSKS
jgi:hypothetical protein